MAQYKAREKVSKVGLKVGRKHSSIAGLVLYPLSGKYLATRPVTVGGPFGSRYRGTAGPGAARTPCGREVDDPGYWRCLRRGHGLMSRAWLELNTVSVVM